MGKLFTARFAGGEERFAALPVDLTYKEYDMAHSVSEESLRDVVEWLAARLK